MDNSTSYKTKQRDQILDCLIRNKDHHITADEIMSVLERDNTPVGRTTVYRYLDKLISQGSVRKFFIEGGKRACYQYMDQNEACSEHYHLKCVGCGQLFHLKCEYLDELDSHIIDHHSFKVDHSKTVLYGCCGDCAKKTGRNEK